MFRFAIGSANLKSPSPFVIEPVRLFNNYTNCVPSDRVPGGGGGGGTNNNECPESKDWKKCRWSKVKQGVGVPDQVWPKELQIQIVLVPIGGKFVVHLKRWLSYET